MLKPHGYITISGDDFVERDSITCCHCNQVVKVKPGTVSTVYLIETLRIIEPLSGAFIIETKEEPGAHCRYCDKATCLKPECLDRCSPLMKRIEQMEAKGRLILS